MHNFVKCFDSPHWNSLDWSPQEPIHRSWKSNIKHRSLMSNACQLSRIIVVINCSMHLFWIARRAAVERGTTKFPPSIISLQLKSHSSSFLTLTERGFPHSLKDPWPPHSLLDSVTTCWNQQVSQLFSLPPSEMHSVPLRLLLPNWFGVGHPLPHSVPRTRFCLLFWQTHSHPNTLLSNFLNTLPVSLIPSQTDSLLLELILSQTPSPHP